MLWSMSAANRAISTIGRRSAIPVGDGTMCCPISKNPKILIGTARIMGAAGHSMSRTFRPMPIPSVTALSRQRRHSVLPPAATSTAPNPKASDIIRSIRRAAGGRPRRTHFSIPPESGARSPCGLTPMRKTYCLKDDVRWACAIHAKGRCAKRRRAAKLFCPAAQSIRRNC